MGWPVGNHKSGGTIVSVGNGQTYVKYPSPIRKGKKAMTSWKSRPASAMRKALGKATKKLRAY